MKRALFFGVLASQAYAAEPTSSLDDLFLIKDKIKVADMYMQKHMPGNAMVQLLEAKGIGNNAFDSELNSRLQAVDTVLRNTNETYIITMYVRDDAQSGQGSFLQSELLAKHYRNGVFMTETGGNYTFTVDMQRLHIEQTESSFSRILLVPVGQTRVLNGEYTALQQRINVECQQYLAAQQQAQGAGIQAVAGLDTTVNSANSNNLWGVALGVTSMVDATNRNSNAIRTNATCQQDMNQLTQMPMYTSETQTTPTRYTETTKRKTADLTVRFDLSSKKGVSLFASPSFTVTFYKEDLARDEIASLGIVGDPAESISDDAVARGVLSSAADTIYSALSQGGGLQDAILFWRAQNSPGEQAVELYSRLFVQGHTPTLKQRAEDYILMACKSLHKEDLESFSK
ncbi:hypothetical protein HZA99_03085 [Candidatus Woesearchaeota archaeon]|nr:hypothetical protein [Candidatus Woesearchaeota archaeon]